MRYALGAMHMYDTVDIAGTERVHISTPLVDIQGDGFYRILYQANAVCPILDSCVVMLESRVAHQEHRVHPDNNSIKGCPCPLSVYIGMEEVEPSFLDSTRPRDIIS